METVDVEKRLVFVKYKCDKCEKGFMSYHGTNKVVRGKVMYLNICNKCKAEKYLHCFYPTVKEEKNIKDNKPGIIITLCNKECENAIRNKR